MAGKIFLVYQQFFKLQIKRAARAQSNCITNPLVIQLPVYLSEKIDQNLAQKTKCHIAIFLEFSTIFLIVKIEFVELEFFFLGVSFQSLSRKWYVNSDDDGNLFLKIFSSDIEDHFINSTIFMIFSIYNDKKRRNLVNCTQWKWC